MSRTGEGPVTPNPRSPGSRVAPPQSGTDGCRRDGTEGRCQRANAAPLGNGGRRPSPKTLASVLRFQHALALVREGEPLAEVAAVTGYSDQAHMMRAFQSFGGFTPGTSLP